MRKSFAVMLLLGSPAEAKIFKDQSGCCQESIHDNKCARSDYSDGKCIKLDKRNIGCIRGYWNTKAQYDEDTGKC